MDSSSDGKNSIVMPHTVLSAFGFPISLQDYGISISPDDDHPIYSPIYN